VLSRDADLFFYDFLSRSHLRPLYSAPSTDSADLLPFTRINTLAVTDACCHRHHRQLGKGRLDPNIFKRPIFLVFPKWNCWVLAALNGIGRSRANGKTTDLRRWILRNLLKTPRSLSTGLDANLPCPAKCYLPPNLARLNADIVPAAIGVLYLASCVCQPSSRGRRFSRFKASLTG
jgi:hypothetical protein